MNKKELEAFAREAAKGIKTEKDLNAFSQMLTKITVETVLNAELDEHLGYDKHQESVSGNSRNGYSSKTLITEDGPFEVDVPLTVRAALNRKLSESTRPVLLPWMTRCIACTPRA